MRQSFVSRHRAVGQWRRLPHGPIPGAGRTAQARPRRRPPITWSVRMGQAALVTSLLAALVGWRGV